MKKILISSLALICVNSFSLSTSQKKFKTLFKDYNACFILYNLTQHKVITEYNPLNYCHQRIAPDSTFKIPLSLMAFNEKMISQNTIFKWDGVDRDMKEWNQNQTPRSWLSYSTIWVSQRIATQLGLKKIKYYLKKFNYGNQDFSGDPYKNNGLKYAWLSSSLKISAKEQLNFLINLFDNKLLLDDEAIKFTKQNMYIGYLNQDTKFFGKTGSGRHGRNERQLHPSRLRDGWFIGYIESKSDRFIFVSNLTDKNIPTHKEEGYGSVILKSKILKILNQYFS